MKQGDDKMSNVKKWVFTMYYKGSYFVYGAIIAVMLGSSFYLMKVADDRKEALRVVCSSIRGDNSLCTYHGFRTLRVEIPQ